MGMHTVILYYKCIINEHIQSSNDRHAMQNMSESAEKHPRGPGYAHGPSTVRGSDIRIYVSKHAVGRNHLFAFAVAEPG